MKKKPKRYNPMDDVMDAFHEMRAREEMAEMERQIARFAKRHKYFKKLRVQMGQLIAAGKATTLEDAYKMAKYLSNRG